MDNGASECIQILHLLSCRAVTYKKRITWWIGDYINKQIEDSFIFSNLDYDLLCNVLCAVSKF